VSYLPLPIFQRTNPVIRKVYPLIIKFLWITTKIGEEPINSKKESLLKVNLLYLDKEDIAETDSINYVSFAIVAIAATGVHMFCYILLINSVLHANYYNYPKHPQPILVPVILGN